MAFAGLKKQINKANQYVTEKMGGAEGTKLDLDFMEMERKTDVTVELVEELQTKTKEYLQPNPTARAKMAAVKGISKLSGQAKSNTYPQPEGLLADCLLLYGKKLGEENSVFAAALVEMGDSLKQMADVKYSLDDNIKQNFLEPLHQLQMKDLKEVMHHRKKLQGRRLDFDCKKRRQAKGSQIPDDEIRSAEEKFAESLQLAQVGMYNLLENDVEQVSQLYSCAEGILEYHSQCTEIMKILVETLAEKKEEAAMRPKSEFIPKTLADLNIETIGSLEGLNGGPKFLNPNKIKNSHQHMYSSHQNLSNNNNNNQNNSHSNFNRNKIYGSQQSLSTTNSNSNSSYSSKSSNNTKSHNNNNNNRNNNNYSGAQNIPVDNWLNAWDSPNSTSSTSVYSNRINNNNHNNYNYNKKTNHKPNNFTDPWAGGSSLNSPVNKPTHLELLGNGQATAARSTNASPLPSPMRSPARTPMPKQTPCCKALYDFEPENPGELGFKENDVIHLIQKVDENWYEGSVNGRTGYFPQSYVEVTVPIPQN